VLVNNVGASRAGGPIELDEAEWEARLALNLTSTYLTCRRVLSAILRQGRGAIVNIASTSGPRSTGAPQVGYAAAKAGVIQAVERHRRAGCRAGARCERSAAVEKAPLRSDGGALWCPCAALASVPCAKALQVG